MQTTLKKRFFIVLIAAVSCAALTSCLLENVRRAPDKNLSTPFKPGIIPLEERATRRVQCTPPPAPQSDLFFESIYEKNSANRSVIDPASYETYRQDTKFLRDYEAGLTAMANDYLRTGNPHIAACVQDWLVEWAQSNALNSDANRTGEFVRKWALASIASAWLQVRESEALDKDKTQKILLWIGHTAENVMSDFSRDTDQKSRQNNHLYWSAWAVALSAIALDDATMFGWAMDRTRYGIDQITKKGTLPLEMERGQMALNYHGYAAVPLFMAAEAAERNGLSLYEENDRALFRLARRVLKGLDDPTYFEKTSGERQDMERALNPSNLVWLEPYYRHTGDNKAKRWLTKLRPLRQSRVGGDASLLYGEEAANLPPGVGR